MAADALDLGMVLVHCFWQACSHTVERATPGEAHDAMEAHYADAHAEQIAAIVGG